MCFTFLTLPPVVPGLRLVSGVCSTMWVLACCRCGFRARFSSRACLRCKRFGLSPFHWTSSLLSSIVANNHRYPIRMCTEQMYVMDEKERNVNRNVAARTAKGGKLTFNWEKAMHLGVRQQEVPLLDIVTKENNSLLNRWKCTPSRLFGADMNHITT